MKARELNHCILIRKILSLIRESWVILIHKDPCKGNIAVEFEPIACLDLIWKLLTVPVADKM